MANAKAKLFRDPIHQMIDVAESELAVIDTPVFQRLRRIRQLALSDWVYPGAEHTRFGHALGTMHMAGRTFDAVRAERELNGGKIEDADYKRSLVRLAALVHDIGHAPFSHAAEDVLFPKGRKHEQIGADIVRSNHLAPVIEKHYGRETIEQVASILDPKRRTPFSWLDSIVSGPLDADKLDYLRRDSHYCGVTYGQYDSARLLTKLVLRNAPTPESEDESVEQIVVTVGGLQAAESVFVARYWMFVQVYYHPVRRQLDHLLGLFIRDEVLKGGTYPVDDVDAYIRWDDVQIQKALLEGGGQWAARLNSSRPYYKVVAEREPAAGPTGRRRWYRTVARQVCDELGAEAAFYDDPSVNTSVTYPSLGALELMVEPVEGEFQSMRKLSDFVDALSTPENRRFEPRVFALPEHEKRAKEMYDTMARDMEER